MTTFTLPLAAYLAVEPALADKGDKRSPAFHFACIHPDGWLAATNGHRMHAVRVQGDGVVLPKAPVLFRLDTKPLIKAAGKNHDAMVTFAHDIMPGVGNDTVASVRGVDTPAIIRRGSFVDWRSVLPRDIDFDASSERPAVYNLRYLSDLRPLILFSHGVWPLDKKFYAHIRMFASDERTAGLVETGSERMAIGLVMPVRSADGLRNNAIAAVTSARKP